MPQIVVQALAKTYHVAERAPGLAGVLRGLVHRQWRPVHGQADVSFSLEAGELLAFIGPNGAGKSTTVKILSDILRPTNGQPVRQLSLGQRMRAEFAAALLHDPSILFLDEPTIGLDAPSKLAVRGFVRRLNREQGVTVLLTTHDMHDVRRLLTFGVPLASVAYYRSSPPMAAAPRFAIIQPAAPGSSSGFRRSPSPAMLEPWNTSPSERPASG